jgi:hypothetical protein
MDSVKDYDAYLQSLISAGFEGYAGYVDLLLRSIPHAKGNPHVQFEILHEMLLRAMFADMNGYLKQISKFPLEQFAASTRDAHSLLGKVPPSFSGQNNIAARELFATYFENYKKMCLLLSSVSKLVAKDRSDPSREWEKTFPSDTSRYSGFKPDPNDFLLRNAISHKTIRRLGNGRFELEDKVAKIRKTFSPEYMDKRLGWLVLRVRIVNYVLSLTSIVPNYTILLVLRAEKTRQGGLVPKKR